MRLARTDVRVSALRIAPVALSVVLAAGCSAGGGSGSASGGGASVTVAVLAGVEDAPLLVGIQDGLFKQDDLNVAYKSEPSVTAEIQALRSGQAQIAVGDYTGFFYEEVTGTTKLQFIADAYDAASNSVAILAVPSATGAVPSAQGLEDQSGTSKPQAVATPLAQVNLSNSTGSNDGSAAPYNMATLAAEEVLQNDGVSPSSVDWQPMSAQNMITDLRDGSVKAILATEPYILEAEEQLGAVEVVDASSGVTSGLPMSGYFSLASYAKTNPSAVQAFQQALDQAQSDCAQRGPVQEVLPNLVSGLTRDKAALVTLGTYPTSVNVGQVQRVASLMYDSGMISQQVNVSSMTNG
jgi:NitT/TauT family transport system substrate-binding protein